MRAGEALRQGLSVVLCHPPAQGICSQPLGVAGIPDRLGVVLGEDDCSVKVFLALWDSHFPEMKITKLILLTLKHPLHKTVQQAT